MAENETAPRDPRLDRLVTWGLQTLMAIVLGVGAWYARETGEKVDATSAQVTLFRTEFASQLADLRTEVAVMRVEAGRMQRFEDRMQRFEDRLNGTGPREPR